MDFVLSTLLYMAHNFYNLISLISLAPALCTLNVVFYLQIDPKNMPLHEV